MGASSRYGGTGPVPSVRRAGLQRGRMLRSRFRERRARRTIAAHEDRDSDMARSMWRGAIQFGLVTIPVKLYLATESGGIGFNLLHASCLNRIQMKVYCPYHDEIIPRSE